VDQLGRWGVGLIALGGVMFATPFILAAAHVGTFGQPADIGAGLMVIAGIVVAAAGLGLGIASFSRSRRHRQL
jgi:hypothetical protein